MGQRLGRRVNQPLASGDEEARRFAAVRSLGLAEMGGDPELLRVLDLIERLLRVTVAYVGIVSADVTHIHARPSLGITSVPRPISVAAYVVQTGEPFVVPDVRDHEALKVSPMLEHGIVFLAGCPLRAPDGTVVGCLTIGDVVPRSVCEVEMRVLGDLARVVEVVLQSAALRRAFEGVPRVQDADALARAASGEATRLAAALGLAPRPTRVLPTPDSRWTDYDPDLARLLSRKGTLPILQRLVEGRVMRFGELLKAVPSMNTRTLTMRLQELQSAGLVLRRQYPSVPPRVEYSLAPDAESFVGHVVGTLRSTFQD